jgi:hypothetical protein
MIIFLSIQTRARLPIDAAAACIFIESRHRYSAGMWMDVIGRLLLIKLLLLLLLDSGGRGIEIEIQLLRARAEVYSL